MNKILITGGAGFIAPHLIRRLLADEDNHILCVDNLSRGCVENISEFESNPRFDFFNIDVLLLNVAVDVDFIYHLASIADYDDYMAKPLSTYRVNVLGTEKVLQIAERSGAKVLFTSSSEIYGSSLFPMVESSFGQVDPFSIRAGYTEGKRMAETLCKIYSERGVDVIVTRLFNIYGKGMSDRVIVEFQKQIKRDKMVLINGTGEQTRCFLWIEDLLNAFGVLVSTGQSGEVFNIGNPEQVTINALADLVAKTLDIKYKKIAMPERENEPHCRIPNIDKIESLGWSPQMGLSEGLGEMLNG